jgi:hypothetical protein
VPEQEDATQHQLRYALGMRDRVRKGEGGAPASTKHLPGVHAQVLPQLLEVFHKVPRRVLLELRKGSRLAAAALVDQNDAVRLRIEVASVHRCRTATWPAVDKEHWLAVRIAIFEPRDRVEVGYREHALVL